MKNFRSKYRIAIPASAVPVIGIYACKKAFGSGAHRFIPETTLANPKGVQGLLIGAYSLLDGNGGAGTGPGAWATASDNWVYGGVVSDDAHKGSDPGDQADILSLEQYKSNPSNGYLDSKWSWAYDGIQRANEVLRVMRTLTSYIGIDTTEVAAEAKFLRGHYHFEAKRMYNSIPYIDENVTFLR